MGKGGVELPFELDTIDAIEEAEEPGEKLIAILIRIAPFILYCGSAALEFLAYDAVNSRLSVICIKYYEISESSFVFLLATYLVLIMDAAFVVFGPLSVLMIYNNPYGVCYNVLAGINCIASAAYFHFMMTFCGNVDQDKMLMAPIFMYLSGFLHLGNAAINHVSFMNLDKTGEQYFGQAQDLIDDIRD